MATLMALIKFQFLELSDIKYDAALDHKFGKTQPMPGEALQPVVAEAVAKIKQCLGGSLSDWFKFCSIRIMNLSNFYHLATLYYDTNIQYGNSSEVMRGIIVTCKFARLCPGETYSVSMDIEEVPNSQLDGSSDAVYEMGLSNKRVEKLVQLLDDQFLLGGRIESIPVIKRGRLDKPHFLVSSDNRMMEYDFEEVLFHQRSEFQDIKILRSASLGNTLLLNNLQNFSEADLSYTHCLMDFGHTSYKDKEILVLGGGDGGLLWELLKERPKFVTVVEIDSLVIEACRDHLRPCGQVLGQMEGDNYLIIVDDCMKVLRQEVKYDVIFNDLTDIPVTKRPELLTAFDSRAMQKTNPWYFMEVILNLSLEALKPDGIFVSHATGKGNTKALEAYEQFLANSRVQVEFKRREAYVPSFMEIWLFYTIWRKL